MRSSVLATIVCTTLVVGAAGCAAREAPRPAPLAAMTAAPAVPTPSRPVSTQGSRGSPAIGNFVRERHAQLQFCYEESRASGSDLSGTVTVAVRLGDRGEVLASDIVRRSWSGDGEAIERCVLGTVRRWRFPSLEPEDHHEHSFAVIFSGGGNAQAGQRDD